MHAELNHDDTGHRAVLYALNALEPEERREVERRRRRDAAFDELVDMWEDRFVALALGAPAVEPPSSLWARIEAELDRPPDATKDLQVVRFGQIAWEPWVDGIEYKPLTRNANGELESLLVRLRPGATIPGHVHDRMEECLIIEGEFTHGDQVFLPGDFTVARTGGMHEPMTSRNGGLIYVRYL